MKYPVHATTGDCYSKRRVDEKGAKSLTSTDITTVITRAKMHREWKNRIPPTRSKTACYNLLSLLDLSVPHTVIAKVVKNCHFWTKNLIFFFFFFLKKNSDIFHWFLPLDLEEECLLFYYFDPLLDKERSCFYCKTCLKTWEGGHFKSLVTFAFFSQILIKRVPRILKSKIIRPVLMLKFVYKVI